MEFQKIIVNSITLITFITFIGFLLAITYYVLCFIYIMFRRRKNPPQKTPFEEFDFIENETEYFNEEEIQEFKDCSINYPLIFSEDEYEKVVYVHEVTSLIGMNENNGAPSRILIKIHSKTEPRRLLTYDLIEDDDRQ